MRRQRVLIYHEVIAASASDASGFPGQVAGRYKLDPSLFQAHLDAIASTGLPIGSVGASGCAALTFDDGGISGLGIADALESRGWRGTFLVVTGRIGTRGFLSSDGLRELERRGHEIGSHSHSHPQYMGRMSRSELAHEWRESRAILGELFGSPPRLAAVPGGSVSPAVIAEACRAGYELLLTSTPTDRLRHAGPMGVLGRYTMWANDPAARAAAYVRGDRAPRARRWLAWQAKSAAKRISPRAYEASRAVRAQRFGRRRET